MSSRRHTATSFGSGPLNRGTSYADGCPNTRKVGERRDLAYAIVRAERRGALTPKAASYLDALLRKPFPDYAFILQCVRRWSSDYAPGMARRHAARMRRERGLA